MLKSEALQEYEKQDIIYDPKEDITAWELAQILSLTLKGSKRSTYEKMDGSCFRHLKLRDK